MMLLVAPMHRIPSSFLLLALTSSLVACSSVVVDDPDTFSGNVATTRGDPLSGVRVQVGDAVTTTDDAGDFEVPKAAGPRDVALFLPDTGSAYVYVGLTDQDHSFRVRGGEASPSADDHAALVTVKFPDKDSAALSSVYAVDFIDSVTRPVFTTDTPSQMTAQERTINAHWRGPHTVKVRLQALQVAVDPLGKAIQHYVGYDSAEVSITDGVPVSLAVTWKPPPFGESKVSVTTKLGSPKVVVYNSQVVIRSPGGASPWSLGYGAIEGSEISFVVPDLAGATFDVWATGADGVGGYFNAGIPGLAAGAKGAILPAGTSLVQVSPGDGGTFGIGTKLEWSSPGDEAVQAALDPLEQGPGKISYLVATAGESVVIPDLSRLGVELSPGVKYGWSISHDSRTPTVGDIAAKLTPPDSSTAPTFFAYSGTWTLTSK
jgi:hypothetical protein